MSRALLAFSFLLPLAWAGIALADDPGGPAPGTQDNQPIMPQLERLEQERGVGTDVALQGQTTGVIIEGDVRNEDGTVLPGVLVKLFGGGTLVDHATTNNEGHYSVAGNPMMGENVSVVLWVQTPDPERYIDRDYIVELGPVAEERGLFPSCTEKIPVLQGRANFNPILLTLEQTKTELEESNCLSGGS
jgi:hypothetical protein